MPQLENNVMELAALVIGTVDHGILSYTVAFVVFIGVSLSTILSPFRPSAMIEAINKTVEKTYFQYDEHKDIVDGSAVFDIKVNRLRFEALRLQERHLEARIAVFWTDHRTWGRYMRECKAIWAKARRYGRESVELEKALKLAIVKARKDRLKADAGYGRQGEETTEDDECVV